MARRAHPTPRLDPDIARLAGVLADPSRIAMLDALLDGNAHTIGALARHAGVTAATASGHLRRLLDEQLVLATHHGRERRVRLASPAVAHLLESIAGLAVQAAPSTATASPTSATSTATTSSSATHATSTSSPSATPTSASATRARELRFARTCYDHLAGVVGVRVTSALLDRSWLHLHDDTFTPAPALLTWLADHGHPLADDPRTRRPLARACLDWSERIPHIAGRLGAAIADLALTKQWVVRVRGTRALRLTARGRSALASELSITFS